jgi:hypothetical protein
MKDFQESAQLCSLLGIQHCRKPPFRIAALQKAPFQKRDTVESSLSELRHCKKPSIKKHHYYRQNPT